MGNWFKTAMLLGVMTALIVFIGRLIGGQQGMIFAFILAIGMNFFSYWFSDKIVLKMYRAREVTPGENPRIYGIVNQIAQKANLPMPRVYVIPEQSPNAFATGRNPEHAVVAVTEGLLNLMNTDEITGVISHEMAHIKNRDILIGSIAATMAGAIMIIASMARWTAFLGGRSDNNRNGVGAVGLLIMSILAPLAAMLIQMAISRSREYLADSTGASFTGHPEGLAGALEKLGSYSKRIPMHAAGENTAHMFIVNPLSGRGLSSLFSTHPPLEDRIARLTGIMNFIEATDNSPYKKTGKEDAEETWKRLMR
ncbi:MAG: zinc metalloprotease HtpX [Deltaproteobacteria bacterium]|nr:zinc metalloprotease HtpX [Deltaproteobacteria bacterium]